MNPLWKLSIILAILTLPSTMYAQGKVSMGLKTGLNICNLVDASFVEGMRHKNGLQWGVIMEIKFKNTALVSEFHYSNEGYRYPSIYHEKLRTRFVYMNVPLLFKQQIINGVSIHFGPQFGLLFDHDIQIERNTPLPFPWSPPVTPGTITNEDYSSSYHRCSMSVAAGLEWQHTNGLGFYSRLVRNVLKFNKYDNDLPNGILSCSQIGVFYRF